MNSLLAWIERNPEIGVALILIGWAVVMAGDALFQIWAES